MTVEVELLSTVKNEVMMSYFTVESERERERENENVIEKGSRPII